MHDAHYKEQQNRSDNADEEQQKFFYDMMLTIGRSMDSHTGVFSFGSDKPIVLDTCFAPGGFATVILDKHPEAKICGLTLPEEEGGHSVFLNEHTKNGRIVMRFMDITKLGFEYGLRPKDIQEDMSTEIVYPAKQFDLAVCDGQLLRTNKIHRNSNLEDKAAARLDCSQLILALNRLRHGGTLVILLHHIEALDNIELLYLFSQIADIQLFKHQWFHAPRSSFYMIAKNVQSDSVLAATAIQNWKELWRKCSFESASFHEQCLETGITKTMAVKKLLEDFGETFIKLAEPIWFQQIVGLEKRSKKLRQQGQTQNKDQSGASH